MQSQTHKPIVGLLSSVRRSLADSVRTIEDAGFQVIELPSVDHARRLCAIEEVPIVLAGIHDPVWRQLLSASDRSPNVIVVSHERRGEILAEVLESGGFDVLFAPLNPDDLQRELAVAHQRWNRRRANSELRNIQTAKSA